MPPTGRPAAGHPATPAHAANPRVRAGSNGGDEPLSGRLQRKKDGTTARSPRNPKRSFVLSSELHPFLGGPPTPAPAQQPPPAAPEPEEEGHPAEEDDEEGSELAGSAGASATDQEVLLAALMERSTKLLELSVELDATREELRKVNKLNQSLARVVAAEVPPKARAAYATTRLASSSRISVKSMQETFACINEPSSRGEEGGQFCLPTTRRAPPAMPRSPLVAPPSPLLASPSQSSAPGPAASSAGGPAGESGEWDSFLHYLLWLLPGGHRDAEGHERETRLPAAEKRALVIERVRAALHEEDGASEASDGLRAYRAARKLSGASEGEVADAAAFHASLSGVASSSSSRAGGSPRSGASNQAAPHAAAHAQALAAPRPAPNVRRIVAAPPAGSPSRPAGPKGRGRGRGGPAPLTPGETLLRMLTAAESEAAAAKGVRRSVC